MKFLSGLILVTIAPLMTPCLALAQAARPGAASLQTQPASIQQPNAAPQSSAPLQKPNLESISESLQAKPQPPRARSIIPESLTQPRKPPTIDPLEYFKVPPLDGGIKVRIGS